MFCFNIHSFSGLTIYTKGAQPFGALSYVHFYERRLPVSLRYFFSFYVVSVSTQWT